MKFLFVSRKKYDIAMENNKKMNEQRKRVMDTNIELQKQIAKLQEEIKSLKHFIKRVKVRTKKSNKNKKQNYFKQCEKCGKIFKLSSLNSQRVRCNKCINKKKEEV